MPNVNVLVPWNYMCCMCVKSLQSCLPLSDPMYCSPPSSSVHGILQARILEWVVMPSSRGSFWLRDRTRDSCSSCIAGRFFTTEPPGKSWYQRSKSHIVPQIDEKDKWHISHLWSINKVNTYTWSEVMLVSQMWSYLNISVAEKEN